MSTISEILNNARSLTKQQLFELLTQQTAANTPIKVITVTDATYKKRNPLGTIYKLSTVDCIINVDYAAQMREKNPDYDKTDRKKSYGTHTTSALITHGDTLYIQVQPKNAKQPEYFVNSTDQGVYRSYKKEVADYILPERSKVETEVPVRRYKFDSIVALHIDGNTYQLSDIDATRKEVLTSALSVDI